VLVKLQTPVTSAPDYAHITRKIAKKYSTVNNGTYAYSVCPVKDTRFSGLIITYTESG
jgi:hypothetical protein